MHVVIKGATLYTMAQQGESSAERDEEIPSCMVGVNQNVIHADLGFIRADLRIRDGKIAEIGSNLNVRVSEDEEAAEIIDATGMVITPGFVDAHSHVGGFGPGTQQDLNELTNPRTPELDALYGINPESTDFEEALAQGITTSCLVPGSGNVIGGWGIVLKSAGSNRLVKHPAVLKAATGINPKGVYSKTVQTPMTRMSIIYLLRSYLRDVQDYMRKKEAAASGANAKVAACDEVATPSACIEEIATPDTTPKQEDPEFDLGLEHGIPVLKKEIPLKVHTYMHDMTQVVEIARDFDIEVTIDHAQGASDFYDTLTDPHVRGVIFGPTAEPLFPGEGGKLDPECCKGLDDRGVAVAVMTDGPITIKNQLIFEMGEAVRWGMNPVRALAMVTSNAAHIVGVEDRVGSLEVGKDADICIWTDLPSLATDAVLVRVLIDGETVFSQDV